MKKFLFLVLTAVIAVPSLSFAGSLDHTKVLTDKSLKDYKSIGVKLFSTDNINYDNVNRDEMRRMKGGFLERVQKRLSKTVVSDLKGDGINAFLIDKDGKNADKADMIIEGEITKIDLGSAVTRLFVGWGAGGVNVSVKGDIKDAKTGEVLAKFRHSNSSGLRNTNDKWEMVLHEAQDLGDKLTDFVEKLRK